MSARGKGLGDTAIPIQFLSLQLVAGISSKVMNIY